MRWTVSKAATEWGLDRRTLTARLKAAGLDAHKSKTFHTREISRAILGDLGAEKVRETRERANLLELERAELEKRLVPLDQVQAMISNTLLPVRQRLLALPSEACARANPEDPLLAREALQTWVDDSLPVIRAGIVEAVDGKPRKPSTEKPAKPRGRRGQQRLNL